MATFLGSVVLPFLLLAGSFQSWSLISLVDLVASILIRYTTTKAGFRFRGRVPFLWFIFIYSLLVIVAQVSFLIVWAILGPEWMVADSWWIKLIGLMKLETWRSPTVIYSIALQLLVALIALVEIQWDGSSLIRLQDPYWERLFLVVERIGSRLRVAFCFLLPAVQLVVGISYPSWLSLPFFICSCIGLVDWSLTSNFLGLFRWWKLLWIYAGSVVCLLYVFQLPIAFPTMICRIADFIGLYSLLPNPDWQEISSGVSLLVFYYMLSFIKLDLEEMDLVMSMTEGSLTEQLLPSRSTFFVRQLRSGVRHTNILLRGKVFRIFSINFFTYGFPISLFALSFWSFHFASICAFGLLAYVGYVLYAFPSLFRLHRLNGLLLIFILLWAVSTYIFNVAFTFLDWTPGEDMETWEMIGMWHYPIPGFFLLAQFCLGILVAIGNLVNNSVFQYLSDEGGRSPNDNYADEVREETKVLVVATIAWGLRKCSRPIMLVLILLIAMKPGFVHAVYMVFFFIYLLSHNINKRVRQSLLLLCETHFAILYILQLDLVSTHLEKRGPMSAEILHQLGLLESDSSWDFMEIAFLACLCAIHNHGSKMLFSFSAVVQHTPCPPVGFSILKAGLNKSVLMSVYASSSIRNSHDSSQERKIALYLNAVGKKFLAMYRSFGTYVSFLTILLSVYLVKPNYISFGYIFLLLFWISGRQIVEKTKQQLWFPLKAYAITVFIFIYILGIFPSFQTWMSEKLDLFACFGFSPEASILANLWECLAILIVMQLYSYERRQSEDAVSEDTDPSSFGIIGFIRRFLVWHSQKILFVALFYASLSPVSAFGFVYLLGLVMCSNVSKASRVPSKSFLIYTGILVTTEYLFQMWGRHAKMFPGQEHYDLAFLLGFRLYQPNFWGVEAGLRSKVLVIAACTLQYNVFHWLDKLPSSLLNVGESEEPCPLFVSQEDVNPEGLTSDGDNESLVDSGEPSAKKTAMYRTSNSWPSFSPARYQDSKVASTGGGSEGRRTKYSFGYIWGSMKESHKWDKNKIVSLRNERFEIQKTTLKTYLKFWAENMFNLHGLEINMIALVLASFALLNAISLLYIASLAACVLLERRIIRNLWIIFVYLFASILILEYFVMWKNITPSYNASSDTPVRCHDCWRVSSLYFDRCIKCWFGIMVDDPRVLTSYFIVFMLACFKLRADQASSFSWSATYREMISQRKNDFVWRDISFETKSMWTFLDYLRLYCYCHLLDLVLALILIIGTLEYDILHLGYLGFAVIFFRMRLTILKRKNKIFKYLRIYNFVVIVLSLAYQSPFLGDVTAGKCETTDYIYEVIGFYKYDYGFKITSRSALVEIIIFVLVSLQSYMFASPEFDYVFRYLEAEQIGAIVREQEKKAAWKTAQLQHIRESEEKKRQRNLQVEKMKSEMLNLQIQLHGMKSTPTARGDTTPDNEEAKRRRRSVIGNIDAINLDNEEINVQSDTGFHLDLHESPMSAKAESPFSFRFPNQFEETGISEITEFEENTDDEATDSNRVEKGDRQSKDNRLVSAVQLIENGVSQVQSLGNMAVNNIVSFLNIPEESDSNEQSSTVKTTNDRENAEVPHIDRSSSLQSDRSRMSDTASLQIGRILQHIWSQMRSNNDVVCYICFVIVFLWNFSLLSMVYLASLFLYALCVNTGPSYVFWVVMLIYTEFYILVQYLYQIIIQHCGFSIQSSFLQPLGFPTKRISASFVISLLPLFLVYLFTLIQSSITAKDGEWSSVGFASLKGKILNRKEVSEDFSFTRKLHQIFLMIKNAMVVVIRSFSRYWKSLTQEAESPPYFVQLSMDVHSWPEDGVQPERIESGINQLLSKVHSGSSKNANPNHCHYSSKVQIQSIERSKESQNVALAVFEVVYASPLIDSMPVERYESLTPAADVAKEIRKAQDTGFLEEIRFPYPILSVIGGGRREIDLYAYIFGADLSVFFLVGLFYQSVIKNKTDFLDVYQLEDQFPKEFVFMLMIIFFLIVVDRIIYLCSFAMGKVIFYIFNLVLFTYAITIYAWSTDTSQQTAASLALRAIYLTKTISLALQAIQIRYGIPHQSTLYQQFLTSQVSRVNYLGYRLYRALPFLYELRCVLDWSCTSTALTMYDWLKLEDIHASLYLVKCDSVLNRARHKPGAKQPKWIKFCNGICLFFILLCVIWAPMLMYSSGNPTNIANPIKDASVEVDIKTAAGRLTFYQTTLCKILPWEQLNAVENLDPQGYLESYDDVDIQLICCQSDANSLWLVPDVVNQRYILSIDIHMDIKFSWVFTRDRPKGKEVVKYERIAEPQDLPQPSEVADVLRGSLSSFRVYNLYPRYLRVTGSGDVRDFEQEANDVSGDLKLNGEDLKWWSFNDINATDVSRCGGLTGPMAIIVSEETPQGFLGETLSKFSIWGLYITFVLAVGRFIRLQCADLRMRIPYENLPACDRLIAICEDIYAARAEGELGVEEVLFWTLVKIYRSPHMLLEYTKPD